MPRRSPGPSFAPMAISTLRCTGLHRPGAEREILLIAPLLTKRLRLRTPNADDLYRYLAYRNDTAALAAQMMQPVELKEAELFLAAQSCMAPEAYGWRMFAVEKNDKPGLIGEVGVFIGAEEPQKGDIGWWFAANHQGQGYALEAGTALIEWCFAHRPLHRLTAHCLVANNASLRLMRRLGLRQERQTVESRYFNGCWHDEVGYALLRREWLELGNDEGCMRWNDPYP